MNGLNGEKDRERERGARTLSLLSSSSKRTTPPLVLNPISLRTVNDNDIHLWNEEEQDYA